MLTKEQIQKLFGTLRRLQDRARYERFAILIDAEGAIGIRKTRDGRRFSIEVRCGMTERPLLELLQKHFRGSLGRSRKATARTSTHWAWCVVCRDAHKCLEKIRRYLRLKRGQADLCLELQRSIDAYNGKRGRALSPIEHRKRERLYEHCKRLNKKGPDKARELFNDLTYESSRASENQLSLF
jgi:hypothetical protein